MSKYLEISENTLIARVFDCVFVLCVLSLVIYAFTRSCRPIQNEPMSYLAYGIVLAILLVLWGLAFDSIVRTQKFEIIPGIVKRYESRFVVFRFDDSYTSEMIGNVSVEYRASHFLFKQRYVVTLLLRSGKRVAVKSFSAEKDASELCRQITDLVQTNRSEAH